MEKLLNLLSAYKTEIDFTKDNLVEDGELDSIDIFEIVEELEKQYCITIPPEEIDPDNFQSISTMYHLIEKLQEV